MALRCSQGAAHDLAGGGTRQLFQEGHVARSFMCREPGADMVLKLDCQLFRRFRARAQNHEGRRYMPPDLVKNAHDLPWEGRRCRRCRSDRQGPPLRSRGAVPNPDRNREHRTPGLPSSRNHDGRSASGRRTARTIFTGTPSRRSSPACSIRKPSSTRRHDSRSVSIS